MGDHLRIKGKFIGWLCLAAASYLAAAALSGAASTYGLTDFPNDRRGEWGPIIVPILSLLSVALGAASIRRLARAYRTWHIVVVAAALTGASLLWLSWQFAHAAA